MLKGQTLEKTGTLPFPEKITLQQFIHVLDLVAGPQAHVKMCSHYASALGASGERAQYQPMPVCCQKKKSATPHTDEYTPSDTKLLRK